MIKKRNFIINHRTAEAQRGRGEETKMNELNKILNEAMKPSQRDIDRKHLIEECNAGRVPLVVLKNAYKQFSVYPKGDDMIYFITREHAELRRELTLTETQKVLKMKAELHKANKKYSNALKKLFERTGEVD